MTPQDLLKLIDAATIDEFVHTRLFSGVPWIFDGDDAAFRAWREAVASAAALELDGVHLVGSAATGFSLSPLKAGRPFRRVAVGNAGSDIDVAIVDDGLFMKAWEALVASDRFGRLGRQLAGRVSQDNSIRDELDRLRCYVYWGLIPHYVSLPGTEMARRLRMLAAATSRLKPFVGHRVSVRVYRRREDLVGYHLASARSLHRSLRDAGRN
jgi:hypothetical protein